MVKRGPVESIRVDPECLVDYEGAQVGAEPEALPGWSAPPEGP